MSRHGYSEGDCDDAESQWMYIRWAGTLKSAIRGKRGQAFFVDLVRALDAMPEKRLVAGRLETSDGVCALGALGRARGIDMKPLGPDPEDYADDPDDHEYWNGMLADAFNIAHQLVAEVQYVNDECYATTPEERWQKVRAWAVRQILPETLLTGESP